MGGSASKIKRTLPAFKSSTLKPITDKTPNSNVSSSSSTSSDQSHLRSILSKEESIETKIMEENKQLANNISKLKKIHQTSNDTPVPNNQMKHILKARSQHNQNELLSHSEKRNKLKFTGDEMQMYFRYRQEGNETSSSFGFPKETRDILDLYFNVPTSAPLQGNQVIEAKWIGK